MNVAGLMELAFIFIPMTFAAANSSIQAQELEDTPPRFWTFVVTAIGLLLLVYGVRALE